MHRLQAYLNSTLCIIFNKFWLDPDKAGTVVAKCTLEACKDVYPDSDETNGTMLSIQRDWLQKFSKSFESEIKKYLDI
jgi:hypothetical protein